MSSGGRISSSPPLILKRTGVENVVENSGKVGDEIFSSVTVIGDESKPELKLTFSESFDKWEARCLFR